MSAVPLLSPPRAARTPAPPSPAQTPAPPSPARADALSPLSRLCLLVLYVVWGSTYLVMRVAVEELPPMLMGGARFLAAGAVLVAYGRLRGIALPTRREWAAAAAPGVLLFVVGNGMVAVAEAWVPSGVAAVVCATMPLLAIGWGRLFGERPARHHLVGIATGVLGVVVLTAGSLPELSDPRGALVFLAPVGWSLGSILTRRLPMPRGPMAAGAPMLWGGLAMLLVSRARGEAVPTGVSTTAVVAVVYLALVGSVLAFTAYTHLLRETPPAVATSYAYVNPLVAVALGAALGGERFGPAVLVGAALVALGVFLTLGRREAG